MRFHRLAEAVPTSRKPEPRAKKQPARVSKQQKSKHRKFRRANLSSIVVDSAADVRDFLEKPRAVDDIDKIDELIKNTGKDEEVRNFD